MTIDNLKNKLSGLKLVDSINGFAEELYLDDGIGLYAIIPYGVDEYGLKGAELEEFTRRVLKKILDEGALPMRGGVIDGNKDWVLEKKYGKTSQEIIDNIVLIWLCEGAEEPDIGEVWFGLPEILHKDHNSF